MFFFYLFFCLRAARGWNDYLVLIILGGILCRFLWKVKRFWIGKCAWAGRLIGSVF